ncbi:hypothetical protein Pmani_026441, partial [Petrolisthes manimaculis]
TEWVDEVLTSAPPPHDAE